MQQTKTPSADRGKSTINLRIETRTRDMIDSAAALLGKTRTEFMIESARQQAIDITLDQQFFALGANDHAAFTEALDNSPKPGPKLRTLLGRKPVWEKN